jgi:hypothetical protein
MSISFIGSTLACVASTPASEDQSGYEALSYTAIGNVVSIGEHGDTSEDVSFTLLQTGRVKHINGAKDGGEISVTIDYSRADAGLTLLEASNNSNTTHSFRITDSDGDDWYFQGVIANLRVMERTASQYKGLTFVIRVQSAEVKVDGA